MTPTALLLIALAVLASPFVLYLLIPYVRAKLATRKAAKAAAKRDAEWQRQATRDAKRLEAESEIWQVQVWVFGLDAPLVREVTGSASWEIFQGEEYHFIDRADVRAQRIATRAAVEGFWHEGVLFPPAVLTKISTEKVA